MAKLWAKKERNKFYLPGEEIKVNRNFAFSGFDLEKDPLSACKNRMLLAVFGFILIYVIIAVRTLGICISGFSPDDGNGEKELPQLKIENPITRADVTDRNGTIIARHVLLNCLGPIIVQVTLIFASAILAISSLSFLGLGIQPPAPEWGNMLSEARENMRDFPHLVLAPGMAIFLSIFSLNLLGDGLRDALDPKLKQ